VKPALSRDFLFGVGTADHQCEAYEPEVEDIHDYWEKWHLRTPRGAATDFRRRYLEDIQLARDLGCNLFRFSIAWARAEPRAGEYDAEVFKHYRNVVEAIRGAGMEPMVTLHHFNWPIHVQKRGSLIAPDFPKIFERFVAEVVRNLGDLVRYWITINEPSILISGYIKPWWQRDYALPPGMGEDATSLDQTAALAKLIPNLFIANRLAREVIKHHDPSAMVSVNPYLLGMPPFVQAYLDRRARAIRGHKHLAEHRQRLSEHPLPERGRIDMVLASLPITRSHADEVDFSESYFTVNYALLVKDEHAADWNRLAKPVALVKGPILHGTVNLPIGDVDLRPTESYAAAVKLLDEDTVSGVMGHDLALREIERGDPKLYRMLPLHKVGHESYGVAVAKGNGDLLVAVERAVRKFKRSGAWATSHRRHFPEHPPAEPPGHALRCLDDLGESAPGPDGHPSVLGGGPRGRPGPVLADAKRRGYLKVGVTVGEPGMCYRDPATGELSGLEVDLARAVAEEILGDASRARFHDLTNHRHRTTLLRPFTRLLDAPLRNITALTTAFNANWWHLGMAGALDAFLCPPGCEGQQDFVGLDYYWGLDHLRLNRAHQLMDAAAGHFDHAPVYPHGLYQALKQASIMFPGLPVVVVENGCVNEADGIDRATYLRLHLAALERAARDGVNVGGYVSWSITSNREWGRPSDAATDFGLYHIDLDGDPELKRVPTPAAEAYRELIGKTRRGEALA
jgi:beta-glucosidase/6-phospho-beta-glucosidase/beta-galactosidase/ABC-type amino acid transport substrate-binding protein